MAQGGIYSRRASEIREGLPGGRGAVRLGRKKRDDFAAEIASMVGGK